MMFLFPNGQKNSEMVTDNYYEEELQYQDVIDAKKRADELQENLYTARYQGIKITFPKDYNNSNTTVKFVLNRTDDQNLDIKKSVQLDASQSFNSCTGIENG
jgi:formamidopyrimidine-DNA glycosylase